MSYSISFNKPYNTDYTLAQYQDRITDDIWFTRLNSGGPLFNYKYYVDNGYTNPTTDQLQKDFWYEGAPNYGGTVGVKWAILSKSGFPDQNAVGINSSLFGTIGVTTNFYSFSQMCVLLTAMINESSKPISLTNPSSSNEWLLENNDTVDSTSMPSLVNKDLCCYIPSINQYFKINISSWGANGSPSITYTRTPLFYPKYPFYKQVLHQNDNYTDYRITYYIDGSALVNIYQKNGTTNCYQLVGNVNVPFCQSPVPYIPPTPPAPPGPPVSPESTTQIQIFSATGATTWTAPSTTTSIEYLVVGGGGGGGGAFDTGSGGGGGAGLVLAGTIPVAPNSTYNIYVGAGGTGGTADRTVPTETSGSNGENSYFNTIIASGGIGGYASRTAPDGVGVGGAIANIGTLVGGGGGNGGGSAGSTASAGGGGGNGSAGGTTTTNTGGVGGSGVTSIISGSTIIYGVGGNGGQDNVNANGANGAANSGNGGVGASSVSFDNSSGGNGGSGIVIIKYNI